MDIDGLPEQEEMTYIRISIMLFDCCPLEIPGTRFIIHAYTAQAGRQAVAGTCLNI